MEYNIPTYPQLYEKKAGVSRDALPHALSGLKAIDPSTAAQNRGARRRDRIAAATAAWSWWFSPGELCYPAWLFVT